MPLGLALTPVGLRITSGDGPATEAVEPTSPPALLATETGEPLVTELGERLVVEPES